MAVFDLHCHLLPGIDDGPDTLAGSLAMARAAVADGITTVTCTPHMIRQYPTAPEDVHRAVDEFRDAAGGGHPAPGAARRRDQPGVAAAHERRRPARRQPGRHGALAAAGGALPGVAHPAAARAGRPGAAGVRRGAGAPRAQGQRRRHPTACATSWAGGRWWQLTASSLTGDHGRPREGGGGGGAAAQRHGARAGHRRPLGRLAAPRC
ncbi:MAG: CpsB/CapC family capsule biosynthesis tyrosine phosphatase [Thermoleophilia bacterium]